MIPPTASLPGVFSEERNKTREEEAHCRAFFYALIFIDVLTGAWGVLGLIEKGSV
jgi:hypothetical protein